jgi:hypothetical protein
VYPTTPIFESFVSQYAVSVVPLPTSPNIPGSAIETQYIVGAAGAEIVNVRAL